MDSGSAIMTFCESQTTQKALFPRLITYLKDNRVFLTNTSWSWVSRLVAGVLQLAFVRVIFKHLGSEEFAIFAAINGILAWLSLFDLGLGQSLQNKIARTFSSSDALAEQIVAEAVIGGMLAVLPIILGTMALFLLTFVTKPFAMSAPHSLFTALGIVYLGQIIFQIGLRILYGKNQANLANTAAALLPLCSIVIFYLTKAVIPSLLFPTFTAGIPLLSASILSIFIIRRALPFIKISRLLQIKKNLTSSLPILREALPFGANALLASLVLQIDYLIIPHTLTKDEISLYAVMSRMFNFTLSIYSAALITTMPYFSREKENDDRKIMLLLGSGFILIIAVTTIILIFPSAILGILAPGSAFTLSRATILLFSLQQILRIISDVFAAILLSRGAVGIFLQYIPIQAAIAFFCMWFLSIKFGLNGVICGLTLSFMATSMWILPMKYMQLKKR